MYCSLSRQKRDIEKIENQTNTKQELNESICGEILTQFITVGQKKPIQYKIQ